MFHRHGRGKGFFQVRADSAFFQGWSKDFIEGAKNVEISFYRRKTKRIIFFYLKLNRKNIKF